MIKENVTGILSELPPGVELVAAAKTRSSSEILEAVAAGIKIIGENYVREAEEAYRVIGSSVKWHLIGHLQRNKVKKAVKIFDMIESVDSIDIAIEINKHCADAGRVLPILIELNSGRESQKNGVLPKEAEKLIRQIATLKNIKVMGLMTMGPRFGNPQDSRLCFSETMSIFCWLKELSIANVEMKYLSMGMSNSYKVAIEEGANLVRIGSRIFGKRLQAN
ncbi:YggS family pyridoxal phosphate-dependent enzyme [Chloroflexota bacterium]